MAFTCVAPHLERMPEWQAWCRSADGKWSATLRGPVAEVESLKIVLQSATYKPSNP